VADLEDLAARIRAAFPALSFTDARLIDEGADHAVVVLDGAWLFRFPRDERYRTRLFPVELNLLAALGALTPVPIPRYRFIAPNAEFGGYALIRGEPLRPALFASLAPHVQTGIFATLAEFLRLVHAQPPAILAQADGAIAHEWTGEAFRERWIGERRAPVASLVSAALLADIDRFYDAYAAAPPPPREVVTHGDLTDEHMLLAPGHEGLAGVIDFGDACLGDPAYDFAFFFAYGEAAALEIARRYDPAGADPGLLARARGHYIRFCVERLRQAAGAEAAGIRRALPWLLQTFAAMHR
jgi:aminoglycoside 2''-phosphotransferase